MTKHEKYVETASLILKQVHALELDDNDSSPCYGILCGNCPAQHESIDGGCKVAFIREWWFKNIIEKHV